MPLRDWHSTSGCTRAALALPRPSSPSLPTPPPGLGSTQASEVFNRRPFQQTGQFETLRDLGCRLGVRRIWPFESHGLQDWRGQWKSRVSLYCFALAGVIMTGLLGAGQGYLCSGLALHTRESDSCRGQQLLPSGLASIRCTRCSA